MRTTYLKPIGPIPKRREMIVGQSLNMSQGRWAVLMVTISIAVAVFAAQLDDEWTSDFGSYAGTLLVGSPTASNARLMPLPLRSDIARTVNLATRMSTD